MSRKAAIDIARWSLDLQLGSSRSEGATVCPRRKASASDSRPRIAAAPKGVQHAIGK